MATSNEERSILAFLVEGGGNGKDLQSIFSVLKHVYGWTSKKTLNQLLAKMTTQNSISREMRDNYPWYISSNSATSSSSSINHDTSVQQGHHHQPPHQEQQHQHQHQQQRQQQPRQQQQHREEQEHERFDNGEQRQRYKEQERHRPQQQQHHHHHHQQQRQHRQHQHQQHRQHQQQQQHQHSHQNETHQQQRQQQQQYENKTHQQTQQRSQSQTTRDLEQPSSYDLQQQQQPHTLPPHPQNLDTIVDFIQKSGDVGVGKTLVWNRFKGMHFCLNMGALVDVLDSLCESGRLQYYEHDGHVFFRGSTIEGVPNLTKFVRGERYPVREGANTEFKGSNVEDDITWSPKHALRTLTANKSYFAWSLNTQILHQQRPQPVQMLLGVHDKTLKMHGVCIDLDQDVDVHLDLEQLVIEELKQIEQTTRDVFINCMNSFSNQLPPLLWAESLQVDVTKLASVVSAGIDLRSKGKAFALITISIHPEKLCQDPAQLKPISIRKDGSCKYRDGEHTKDVPHHQTTSTSLGKKPRSKSSKARGHTKTASKAKRNPKPRPKPRPRTKSTVNPKSKPNTQPKPKPKPSSNPKSKSTKPMPKRNSTANS